MVFASCAVPLIPTLKVVGAIATLVTATVEVLTVTLQIAVFPPSAVVAVIVVLPAAIAVTNPLLFTVATAALLEVQLTFLFVAFEGLTVAVSCVVPFTDSVAVVGVNVTPVTAIVLVGLPFSCAPISGLLPEKGRPTLTPASIRGLPATGT
jgi:hypothetical protein